MTLEAEALLGPVNLPRFVVKQLSSFAAKNRLKNVPTEADLAVAITEIEIQTQIYGSSFIKVHLADPEWRIITSGLLQTEASGLLNEIELEFPEQSGYKWRLAACEGSTDTASPYQLLLTFEDVIVANLRKRWEHRLIAPGGTTRPQFAKTLVEEANNALHLKPPIRFVCPGVTRREPLAGQTKTKRSTFNAETRANRERGLHIGASSALTVGGVAITPDQLQVADELLRVANEQNAGSVATEALIYAAIGETKCGGSVSRSSAGAEGVLQSLHAPFDTPSQAKNFLKGNEDFQKGGAKKLAQTVSNPEQVAVEVEAPSTWPTNAYATQTGGQNYLKEAQAIIAAGGGVRPGGTIPSATSETAATGAGGQISRGVPGNPDEDSWDCIHRLMVEELHWFVFTDGKSNLFCMTGQDMIHQKPVAYLEVKGPQSKITWETEHGRKDSKEAVLVRPFTFNIDNTSYQYRALHKLRGRTQRRSQISKPNTPAEIRMNLICAITGPQSLRAGDVVVLQNSGPIAENGGRWIVADATRYTMKEPYTRVILVPPSSPAEEIKATTGTALPAGGAEGKAAGAFEAANQLSQKQVPYLYGGGHGSGQLSNASPPNLDCSSSVCWVLHQAGMYASTTAQTSGELAASFGEAGTGKEMTVWANSEHTFIEFNIPGHQPAQLNTNGPQNGPRLYTQKPGESGSYNPHPSEEKFTARHFPGT